VTLLGGGAENSDLGILLREGTAGELHNVIVTRFGEACFTLDHNATFGNAGTAGMLSGELLISNSILWCPDSADFLEPELDMAPPFTVEAFIGLNDNVQVVNPQITDATGRDLRPAAGSPALGAGVTPSDAFFDSVDYIGAFGSDDWTAGWTNWAVN
jgi:hypothetical protein